MDVSKWVGKAVSIECDEKLGVFQGIIRGISEHDITIVRAFRNGVPLRKQNAEVTLRSKDILDIKIIPSHNTPNTVTPSVINKPTPVKQPNFMVNKAIANCVETAQNLSRSGNQLKKSQHQVQNQQSQDQLSHQQSHQLQEEIKSESPIRTALNSTSSNNCTSSLAETISDSPKSRNGQMLNQNVAQFFGNLIPAKVEVLMGAVPKANSVRNDTPSQLSDIAYGVSSPIDFPNLSSRHSHSGSSVNGAGSSFYNNNNNKNGNRRNRFQRNGNNFGFFSNYNPGFQNGSEPDFQNGYNSSNGQSYNNLNGYSNPCGSANCYNQNSKRRNRQQSRRENLARRNQAFGTNADDPLKNGDFDFEGNLALFDKRAIWNNIEAEQKFNNKDKRAQGPLPEEKYRHDENILASKPLQLRQIETNEKDSIDFVTDDGVIIPTISIYLRSKIETMAVRQGYAMQRQLDVLSRGASDLVLSLLGGARRFTPNNVHQWPKVTILCFSSLGIRCSAIGAVVGRFLASHGLTVTLYLREKPCNEEDETEISLFKDSGNNLTFSVDGLEKPDLTVLISASGVLTSDLTNWLDESRAPILAIDPPPSGVAEVNIKYAIFPILPIHGLSEKACGKLFLCNIGLPEIYYTTVGLPKYKSPFGHKYVIPIYPKD